MNRFKDSIPGWRTAVRKYGLGYCAVWTLTILFLATLSLTLHHLETIKDAEHEAQVYYELNLQYRAWNARAGGVYVPTDRIPPNPYLTFPGRDVTTTGGRTLTLVNPAYMTSMVFEAIRSQPGQPVISRLTSLKPLNPRNIPDEWEKQALLAFEGGKRTGTSQVVAIEGAPYLRLISPFITEHACLKCHAVQGYKTGDIRGGISIAVPLAHHQAAEARTRNYFMGGYLLLWVTGVTGIARSSRRRFANEAALRTSESKYKSLFESMQEGFALHEIICAEDGSPVDFRYLEVNPAFEKHTGLNRSDVVGRTAREVLPDTGDAWIGILGEVALTGVPRFIGDYAGPMGRSFEVHVFSPAPRQFAIIFTDVTERRRLQDEALKAQKLESLGLLAGGIAHDFNNILTAVIGNISLARMQLPAEDQIAARLEKSEQAAMRATELTRQLITFAKGGEPLKRAIDTGQLVRDAASFSLHGSICAVEFDLPPGLWYLYADSGQVHQAINNLVINAVQAMPGGGTIFIRAENATIDARNELSLMPGRYVKISLADQGEGIPPGNITRIFDPYFSTKSSGTGLGLSSVYSIIRRHGGSIQVTSSSAAGTEFAIHLPATDQATEEGAALSGMLPVSEARASILLLDDEEMIREMAGEMLETLGYRAVTCAEGTMAIQLYRAALDQGDPFAAAILDMTIPGGMGGRETAEAILSVDPDAVLVLSSGYTPDLSSGSREHLFRGSVAKPYNARQLGEELTRLLNPPVSPQQQPAEP